MDMNIEHGHDKLFKKKIGEWRIIGKNSEYCKIRQMDLNQANGPIKGKIRRQL